MPPFDSEQELPLKNGQKKSPYEKGQMRGKFITSLVYHICIHYARYFSENFPLFLGAIFKPSCSKFSFPYPGVEMKNPG